MLGVEKVLVGLVNELDDHYTISVKIVDTLTREVEVTDQISFHYEIQDIQKRIEELAARLAEKVSHQRHDMLRSAREGFGQAGGDGSENTQKLDLEAYGEIKDMNDLINVIQSRMKENNNEEHSREGEEGYDENASMKQSEKIDLKQLGEMVFIPEGSFIMGSDASEEESPPHEVYLDAFYMDKYEVTNAQYEIFWRSTGHRPPLTSGKPGFDAPDQPATGVSWEDAVDYAAWAGKRLPTEAEWEKAARGTDSRSYPWGDHWSEAKCQASGKNTLSGPARVGSHPKGVSPFGCHDMAGNVWEWCADWFSTDYYDQSEEKNPKGPQDGSRHVLRGGGWESRPNEVKTTYRQGGCPDGGYRCAGFRCVKDATDQREDP